MPISYAEQYSLSCSACHADFSADVWALVDAAERPDLAAELRAGTLNIVVCSRCGHQQGAGAPLLFHDPESRRVYFAVPPAAEEHRWREQAQALLHALVASLPEEQRRAYLGDVQVEHELDGVRRAVLRRDRLRGRSAAAQAAPAAPIVREAATEPTHAANAPRSTIVEAVRELLAADSEAQFAHVLGLHSGLLSDQGDALIQQLADLAYSEGNRDVGNALRELRATLAGFRGGTGDQARTADGAPAATVASEIAGSGLNTQRFLLPEAAYQALLNVAAPNELAAVARDYPALLEEWADADLIVRIEAALDEGNERLARVIEACREALAELRMRVRSQE